MRKIRVLIVEDEFITADHIADILVEAGFEALTPALNYSEAIELLKEKPDVAILDINLGASKSGIDLAHYLNENVGIPFVFLSSYVDQGTLDRAKKTFPKGFLTKPYKANDFKAALEMALAESPAKAETNKKIDGLSVMEQRIVRAISEHKTSKEIAVELGISISTVKNHRHNICRKLELPSENNALLSWAIGNT